MKCRVPVPVKLVEVFVQGRQYERKRWTLVCQMETACPLYYFHEDPNVGN